MKKKILFFPDVHGRDFWKDAITHIDEFDKVVFNGDYLDPYAYECIGFNHAFGNLEEIIQWKKDYMDKIVLLLGNHDLGYLDKDINTCRRDYNHASQIRKIFQDNLDLFDMAWETEICGQRFFFSHAGVKKDWLMSHRDFFFYDEDKPLPIADLFNNFLHCDEQSQMDTFYAALSDVSRYRGGFDDFGSMVWSDIDEWIGPHKTELIEFPGVMFIFGHSQLESKPIATNYFADLDVRKPFIIGDDGVIYEYSDGEDLKPIEIMKLQPMTDEIREEIKKKEEERLKLLSAFFI
jgi:predicted phosphodiesterase